jgi:hypothetical protein
MEIENIAKNTGKFMGAYPIRSLGHGEQGIHMPAGMSGIYLLYLHFDGKMELIPAEKR